MNNYEASLSPQDRRAFWIDRFNKWREDQEKLGPAGILNITFQPSLWLRSACDNLGAPELRPIATVLWKEVDRERLRTAYTESRRCEPTPLQAPRLLDSDPRHPTAYRHQPVPHPYDTLIPETRKHATKTYPYDTFKKILEEVAESILELHAKNHEWGNIRRYIFLGHAGCTFAVNPGKNIGQLLMFKKIVDIIYRKQGGKGRCEMYASVELRHRSLLKPEKFTGGKVDDLWSSKDFNKKLTDKGKTRWGNCLSSEREFLAERFKITLLSKEDILGHKSQFTDGKDALLFAPNGVFTSKDLNRISKQSFQILICRNLIGRYEICKLAQGDIKWPHKLYKIPGPPFVDSETKDAKELDLRIAYLKSHYHRDLPTAYALGHNLVDDVPYGDSLDYCIYWPSLEPNEPHKHFCWIWDLLEVNRPIYQAQRKEHQEGKRHSLSKGHHSGPLTEQTPNTELQVRHLDSESCFMLVHMWIRKLRMMVDYYNMAKKPAYETLTSRSSAKSRDLAHPF